MTVDINGQGSLTLRAPSPAFATIIERYQWVEVPEDISDQAILNFPGFVTGVIFSFPTEQNMYAESALFDRFELPLIGMMPPTTILVKNSGFNRIKLLRIVFLPGMLHQVFGLQMSSFRNIVPEFPYAIQDRELKFLRERMLTKLTLEHCILEFEAYLRSKLSDAPRSTLFQRTMDVLQSPQHIITAPDLAQALNMSKRSLNRHLNKEIGISAKQVLILYRVNLVLDRLTNAPFTSLGDLAWQCGYYDQAHMAHEVKELLGLTPSELLARREGVVFPNNLI